MLRGPFPDNGLVRGISDGIMLSADPAVREYAVALAKGAGASVVRIPVNWAFHVAPKPPLAFDPTDPGSAAYNFAGIDAAVRSAVAGGLEPLLVVSHAPAFAEAPRRWPFAYAGSWAPSPQALGQFATALARRYDGSFPDPLDPGRPLPRVNMFQAWNEPNLARYLEPQWVAEGPRWRAFSPLLYRQLLNAFYAGIKLVQASDVVVAAGLAPTGDPPGTGRMAPLMFLQELFCLGAPHSMGRPPCEGPAHFDVLAFHPLSVGNPDRAAPSSLDVSVSDAAKVTTLLARAVRLRTALPTTGKQVWVTELNWESAPQSRHGVPPADQAAWISRALHRLWVAGVQLVDWEFLVDPYPALIQVQLGGRRVAMSRPAGLYTLRSPGLRTAQPKPFLRGFELPFDPQRINRRDVRVWALVMAPGERPVLQRLRHHHWRSLALLRADRWGVVNAALRLAGPTRLRLVADGVVSAAARVR
ncbi:MAG TPA: hypothetical protein VGN08_12260 [Solirubrobacteraceae bacterium]|jgi:hypothetical protein